MNCRSPKPLRICGASCKGASQQQHQLAFATLVTVRVTGSSPEGQGAIHATVRTADCASTRTEFSCVRAANKAREITESLRAAAAPWRKSSVQICAIPHHGLRGRQVIVRSADAADASSDAKSSGGNGGESVCVCDLVWNDPSESKVQLDRSCWADLQALKRSVSKLRRLRRME